jgi:hypothetical protein
MFWKTIDKQRQLSSGWFLDHTPPKRTPEPRRDRQPDPGTHRIPATNDQEAVAKDLLQLIDFEVAISCRIVRLLKIFQGASSTTTSGNSVGHAGVILAPACPQDASG